MPHLTTVRPNGAAPLIERLRSIAARETDEIAERFPHVMRRVGGYNLDAIQNGPFNTAKILVGSEGTLAFFTLDRADAAAVAA